MKVFKALAIVSTGLTLTLASMAAPQITKIEADFTCAVGATSQYSFKMTPGQEKVWMSAPNATEGIPLNVVSVARARCPGCFTVKADWDQGTFEFTISGSAQGGANAIKVVAAGNPDDPDAQSISAEGTCKKVK